MAVYSPESLGIKPPAGGFQQGGWYGGRQYWGGTLSDPGVIHPSSNQQGAGQAVSKEVNAQSAAAQGKSPQEIEAYLEAERRKSAAVQPASPAPAPAPSPMPGATVPGGAGAGAGLGITAAPTINLPDLYKNLYSSSGISDLEADLSAKEKEFIEATGKINDNPFLSEATRVGRVAKLDELYQKRTANLRNDIATKKADIETQLNLQTKQFDINSQAARDALSQLNTLLSMGALNNASGEDIANLTRSTGISSTMIQSAIAEGKKKDQQTQVITSTNDAGVVTVSVIDPQTGSIIKQTSLGAIGNAQTGSAKATESDKQAYYSSALREDAGRGVELTDIFKIYTGYLDPNTILNLYNANSMYGPAKETYKQLEKYGVKNPNL